MFAIAFFPLSLTALVALAVYLARHSSLEWKGRHAERLVYKELLHLPDEYILFNDLWFGRNGIYVQIDHLVVSPYGVFVIETKGHRGWILGSEYSEWWTQSINGRRFSFFNPIKQNEGHVRYLHNMLRHVADIPLVPIVVFNNSTELKVHAKEHIVINRCSLVRIITEHSRPVLTKEEIDKVVDTINANTRIADEYDKQMHKAHIEARRRWTERQIAGGVCPECGGRLVRRYGKFGAFYGCANFPRCRFTATL